MTKYFKRVTEETMKNGYILIDNITNRKSYLPFFKEFKQLEKLIKREGFWDEYRINKDKYREQVRRYFRLKGDITRMSQNYPIQGVSGSMTKLACIYLYNALNEANLDAHIVNVVHDEIVVECYISDAEKVKVLLEDSMIRAGKVFCKIIDMGVTTKITKEWDH
jgi:DNA polymerase-1